MLARQLSPQEVARCDPAELTGAVLLAPVRLSAGALRKGSRLDAALAAELIAAAQEDQLRLPLRVACPGKEDLHEDEAAERLATAVAGEGIISRAPRLSRLDLEARWDGVLHIRTSSLLLLNTIDPLEVFTLFHGQAVNAGQVVASVKVAPHLVPAAAVEHGVLIARESGPLIAVRPYVSRDVAALAVRPVSNEDGVRFESSARLKVEALGSRFLGASTIASEDIETARREIETALRDFALTRSVPVLLVGGVSAGDPLSPFYGALEHLGGKVLRQGVPAHPGSMIWLAGLAQTQILGLPQCGMFSMATAADLILPRLLTGEWLTAAELADLAHGGLLTGDMRFRFPSYARLLPAPDA